MKELIAALDLETIPQVSLGTAAVLIFGACAVLAVVRGLLRIFAGSLVIFLSGFVAYQTWRHAPAIDIPGGPWIAPVIAGAVVFFILRAVLHFAVRPFGKKTGDGSEAPRRSPKRWLITSLFSLIPTSLLWFTGAAALRNIGSVAEIQRFVEGDHGTNSPLAFVAELKETINSLLPEGLFQGIDPLADDARVTLAKLIALGDKGTPPKAIPVMEEPEIKALIQHDRKLRELAKQRRYADILRDPRLDNVMANPDLKKMLANLML
ncbi:MAG: CvpA family protein [Verrucomicrobiaceae bacterium]|nr:MAG: CvpA family protein [Verrucomicrobiaceae bacterium]